VLWLSKDIVLILVLLASIAVFPSFEVVIGASTAFPSAVWEDIGTDEFLVRPLLFRFGKLYCLCTLTKE
jgi:hypothetical protein